MSSITLLHAGLQAGNGVKHIEDPQMKVGLEAGNGVKHLEDPQMEGPITPPAVLESVCEVVSPQQANNLNEDRKSALKFSLMVIAITWGGIYSIFSGLPGIKGHYYKHVLMACTLLMMVTMLSGMVLMGLAFTDSTKEWVIRILNRAKYISLVLLTFTGLTTAITFLLSLK